MRLFGQGRETCFFAYRVEGLAAELDRFGQGGCAEGEMTHFPSGTGFGFAVEMEGSTGKGEEWRPVGFSLGPEFSEKVEHDSGSERGDVA